MARNAVMIDGNWCYGCHSCELACQQEKKFPAVDQMGIQVVKLGIWDYEKDGKEMWQDSFLAIPTDQCDGCEAECAEGHRVPCEAVCPAQALTFGDYAELTAQADKPRQLVYRIK